MDFILINQRSRQQSKNSAGKTFFRLLDNANFDYACRKNVDNSKFEPTCDDIDDIPYIRQYLFDSIYLTNPFLKF